MHQNYLKKLILLLIIFAFPLMGNWLFLFNCGELLPVEKIAEIQHGSENCIVGLATRGLGYHYKRARIDLVQPDLLLLGSSRVLQFRDLYFSHSVYNAGSAMTNINEGFSFTQESFKKHTPKIIILGIDYRWFHPDYVPTWTEVKPPPLLSHRISLRSYLLPYQWLWEKKISFSQYVQNLNPLLLIKPQFKKSIGVDGILNHNGFEPNGATILSKWITSKAKSLDEKLETSCQNAKQNKMHNHKDVHIDLARVARFKEMLAFFKMHDIDVIGFIPPLAPKVVDEIGYFPLMEELRGELEQLDIPVYDFHDPRSLHSTDCEFFDGPHGGDFTYAKILHHLASHEPQLKPYLNQDTLNEVTSAYHDIALIPTKAIPTEPEVDFLKLGCNKSSQYALQDRNTSTV